MRQYRPPELLADHHDLTEFRCRSKEQTEWLRRYARQSAAVGTTRVFVVTEHHGHRVVAYYAWCMAQLHTDAAPSRARKGAGRYPQPVALLARLGVDIDHERAGLAAGMLQDIFAGSPNSLTTLVAEACSSTPNPPTPATSTSISYPSSSQAPLTNFTSCCS